MKTRFVLLRIVSLCGTAVALWQRVLFLLVISLMFAAMTSSAIAQTHPGAPGDERTEEREGDHTMDGIVTNAKTGQPLANASVALTWTEDRSPLAETRTDSQGRFAFSHLYNGKYSLRASHRGFIAAAFEEHDSGSTAIVTGSGLISTGLQFKLQPQATIYGVVAEDSGDPVPQARITLYRLGGEGGNGKPARSQQTMADEDGNFEISNLAPGRYYLSVIARPWYAIQPPSVFHASGSPDSAGHPHSPLDVAYPVTYYPDVADPAYAAPIEVGAGERVPINLTLHPVPAIHIHMQFASTDTNPITMPQLRQTVFGFSEFVQSNVNFNTPDQRNSANPITSVELSGFAPGQYDLTLLTGNGDAGSETTVNLSSDQTLDVSSAAPLTPVSGKVTLLGTDPDAGQTAANAQRRNRAPGQDNIGHPLELLFTPQQGDSSRQFQPVAPDGAFRLQGVQPGVYEFSAFADNNPLAVAQLTATGATVDGNRLRIGSEPVVLSAKLAESTATVHGFAKLDGKPASGVFLELVPMDKTGPIPKSAALQTNQSDSDGSFDFPHVLPGSYVILAIQEGWTLDVLSADSINADAIRPYLARGLRITVPPHSRDIVLKDAVEVQPK